MNHFDEIRWEGKSDGASGKIPIYPELSSYMTGWSAAAIEAAADLDALCDALNLAEKSNRRLNRASNSNFSIEARFGIDLADLPVFGGERPRDTHGIFSWDADRFLIANGSCWCIAERS